MKLYFFIFFHFLFFPVFGQKYSFVSYSTKEGLPQSQVTAITQDSDGYLWVGTLGGLAKFNGKDFVSYSSESGLLNNRIFFLNIIDNELWIGHEGGISCYNKSTFQKWAFKNEDRFVVVKDVLKFGNRIIIATDGGGLYQIVNHQLSKINLKNEDFNHIDDVLVCNDEFFLATWYGVLHTKDFKKYSKVDSLYDYEVTGIKLWNSKVLVTTMENGLFTFDHKTQKVAKFELKNEWTKENYFINSFIDSYNNCWLISSLGIIKIDAYNNKKIIDESNGLPLGDVSSVYEDSQKNIWFGTLGKGLIRFPGEKFVYYNKSNGFSSDLVLNVNQDSHGDLWFGTFDKGVMIRSKNGGIITHEFPNNRVWASVLQVDGMNWFATNHGLVKLSSNGSMNVLTRKDQLPGDIITALYKVNSNQMFIGGEYGVSHYEKGKFKLLNHSGKTDIGKVRSLTMINGELFCGTSKGLFVFRNHRFGQIKLVKKAVYCIEKDKDNNLWIGTEEGLFIYSKKKLRQFRISKTPSSNLINFLNYKDGKMYIGTNNGLYVVTNYNHSYTIAHFGVDEGIVDLETNLNSSFFDHSGNFWFGTASGVVRFRESEHQFVRMDPKIDFKSILLNYESFDYSKYSTKLDKRGFPLNLELPHSKNNIRIDLDGILLNKHEDLQYQYKIQGLTNEWSPLTNDPSVSFSSLPSGDYVFRFRSFIKGGGFSNIITLPVNILAPFYRTTWFIALVGVIFIGIIYLFLRYKRRQFDIKRKILVLEQKALFAQMNPHFIFNTLNSIQSFHVYNEVEKAEYYLGKFSKLLRETLQVSRKSSVSLKTEIGMLEKYMELEQMRFSSKFSWEIICTISEENLMLRIPSMLIQPYIENAVKHGFTEKREDYKIEIYLQQVDESTIKCTIVDNGIGRKVSVQKKAETHTLKEHVSYGERITKERLNTYNKVGNKYGIVFVDMEKDGISQGTRVEVLIPILKK